MVVHRRTVSELVISKGNNSGQTAPNDPISWSSNNKASTPYKQCAESGPTNWSYCSLTGTRNRDHYLSALDLLLKSRQECYRMRKTKSFWKNYAFKMSGLVDEELPITPSPSDISVASVRQNVIHSQHPVDNARHLVLPDCVAEGIGIMKSGGNLYTNDRHGHVGESQSCERVKLDGCEIVGPSSSHKVTSDSFCDITGSTQVDSDESSLSVKSSLQRSWNSSLSIKQYSDTISVSDMETNLAAKREENTSTCIDKNESSTTTRYSTSDGSHKVSKEPLPLAPKRGICKMHASFTKVIVESPLRHGSTPTQKQSSLLPISSARRSALNGSVTATNTLPRAKCFSTLMK